MKSTAENQEMVFKGRAQFKDNFIKNREARLREQSKIVILSEETLTSKNLAAAYFTNFVKTEKTEFFAEIKKLINITSDKPYLSLSADYDLAEYNKEDDNLKDWKKERISNILGVPFEKLLVFKHRKKEWWIFCNPQRVDGINGYPLVIMDPYHLMRPVSQKQRTPQEQAEMKYNKKKECTYCLSNLLKDNNLKV